jgi:hypothetical protein
MTMYRGVETQLHTLTSALDGGDTLNIKSYLQINSLEKLSSVEGTRIIIMAVKSVSKTSIHTAQLK